MSPRARRGTEYSRKPYQPPTLPTTPRLLGRLGAAAALALAAIGLVGGWTALGIALAVAAAVVLGMLAYVGGADVMDGQYRKPLRLVRRRGLSMLGWSSLVAAARTSAGFEYGARPEIQRLYAVRLAERHGVSLHAEPEKAAALIGPELWPWVDPKRPAHTHAERPPHHVFDRRTAVGSPPPPDAVLRALVDRLERL